LIFEKFLMPRVANLNGDDFMIGKVFSGLLLVCISSSLMATSPYPIKALKQATKKEIASYEAKSQEVMMKYVVATPLEILQKMPFNTEGGQAFSWCAKRVKNTQICTYRLENIGDDSVAGEVYRLTFTTGEASWKVTNAQKAWRCQPKRGYSTSYHTSKCK